MKIRELLLSILLCSLLCVGYGLIGCGSGGSGFEEFNNGGSVAAGDCDADGDGYLSYEDSQFSNCAGEFTLGVDCDDEDSDDPEGCDACITIDDCAEASCTACAICINPAGTEICGDLVDNNCNGKADEAWPCPNNAVASTVYDPKMSKNSTVVNNLACLFLIPVGTVIFLKIRRRKK